MLRAIKKIKIHEEVFNQIQQLIKDGRLRARDQLPSERELAETFKVSRTSVREALRLPRDDRSLDRDLLRIRPLLARLVNSEHRLAKLEIRNAGADGSDHARKIP